MIIVGAKGFAKELLEVAHELGYAENLVFFDNVSTDLPEQLFDQFPILRSQQEVDKYFLLGDKRFALGLGNPVKRQQLCVLFESWGGKLTSLISQNAHIGSFGVELEAGATILAQACVTSSVIAGKGLLMYPNAVLTHDCVLGDFVELAPGATALGKCTIGQNVHIGANSTILPGRTIGNGVQIGAGAVVTRDVNNGEIVKGVPAR